MIQILLNRPSSFYYSNNLEILKGETITYRYHRANTIHKYTTNPIEVRRCYKTLKVNKKL